jgi:endonuclease/exonuclease/phosphatase family metal-dependent hydrolase
MPSPLATTRHNVSKTRIATWNVERPKADSHTKLPRLTASMREIDADVWILTETHANLTPGANYHPVSSAGYDRTQQAGESWVTIWSRLKVLATPRTVDPVRTACAVVRLSSGRELVVYGTVLPWLGSSWRDFPPTGGKAFAAALDAQRSDWKQIRSEYPDAELCVAGDLNQDLQDRHYYGSTANRSALRESLAQEMLTCVTAGDRDPVSLITGTNGAAIDHILLSEGLHRGAPVTVGAWPQRDTPDRTLSDHYGLWADLIDA